MSFLRHLKLGFVIDAEAERLLFSHLKFNWQKNTKNKQILLIFVAVAPLKPWESLAVELVTNKATSRDLENFADQNGLSQIPKLHSFFRSLIWLPNTVFRGQKREDFYDKTPPKHDRLFLLFRLIECVLTNMED